MTLSSSRFTNNIANVSAGVVLSVNTDVNIDNCLFENNRALLGDGGSLYLDCQDSTSLPCSYHISNTVFKNNSAQVNGGAIKYTYFSPNTTVNNTFTANKAAYGPNVASYPV